MEAAWLDHCLTHVPQARYLMRSTRGYLLLGAEGGRKLMDLAEGAAPGRADAISRLLGRGDQPRHRAEGALRAHAVDRAARWAVARMVRRQGAIDGVYFNTGHADLSPGPLADLGKAGMLRAVLIHDLIPISHPDLVPEGQPRRFAEKIAAAGRHADLILSNSDNTTAQLDSLWQGQARMPERITAPIGIPMSGAEPQPGDPRHFVFIGTLEPRKNLGVLLEAWDLLARDMDPAEMPVLHVIGPPGWRGAEIVAAIRAHPGHGRHIHWHGPLRDADLSRHLHDAGSLLYPTLAEGFGLPPWEALAHGAMPICSDLPVLRQLLGNSAVYVKPRDAYSWAQRIRQRVAGTLTTGAEGVARPPTWQEHFDQVADAVCDLRDRRKGRR